MKSIVIENQFATTFSIVNRIWKWALLHIIFCCYRIQLWGKKKLREWSSSIRSWNWSVYSSPYTANRQWFLRIFWSLVNMQRLDTAVLCLWCYVVSFKIRVRKKNQNTIFNDRQRPEKRRLVSKITEFWKILR